MGHTRKAPADMGRRGPWVRGSDRRADYSDFTTFPTDIAAPVSMR